MCFERLYQIYWSQKPRTSRVQGYFHISFLVVMINHNFTKIAILIFTMPFLFSCVHAASFCDNPPIISYPRTQDSNSLLLGTVARARPPVATVSRNYLWSLSYNACKCCQCYYLSKSSSKANFSINFLHSPRPQ